MAAVGCLWCAAASAAKVEVAYDHADASYYVGQTATFTVKVLDDAGVPCTNGTVRALLDNFGSVVVTPEATFDLAAANPFKVSGKLDAPGFLRICLRSADVEKFPTNAGSEKDGGRFYCESVGIAPGSIRLPVARPKDFKEFWTEAIAKYDREIPDKAPEIRLDEQLSDATWNVWRVSFAAPGGRKVHGFVAKEKAAPEGRLPARVQISAAGYGGWSQSPVKIPGHVSLFMTVYPFEPDPACGKKAEYDALDAAALAKWNVPRYCHGGISESREAYFFYPVILANNRAIDWFGTREDVDPMRLTYTGTSQGGGLGFAATALNRRIRRAALFVPALTGLSGYKGGYMSGWPKIVETHPESVRAEVEKNAPYFDGANFASLIKVPVKVAVGYSDTTCPAPDVWGAFNSIDSYFKEMTPCPRMTHSVDGKVYKAFLDWLDDVPETEALWPEGRIPDKAPYQTVPEMEWYAPTARVTKACIIVAPGGGYSGLAYRHEGLRTAQNFLARGFHVVILRYRTPPNGVYYKSAWQDAQRCVRLVRAQAAKRGIDPEKIGMTGFSAGGHLTCKTATSSLARAYEKVDELDDLPCHLNFAVPVYPAYLLKYPDVRLPKRGDEVDCPLAGDLDFDAKTPPMCFIHGDDDGHSAVGSIRVYEQLRRMKIRGEIHVYSGVNHGFGGSVRHSWNPSGWELVAANFAATIGIAPRWDFVKWPDER